MNDLRTVGFGVAGFAALLAATLMPTAAAADCRLQKIADLPVTLLNDKVLVDAKFGSRDVRFVLDTGSTTSLIPKATAVALGLKIEQGAGVRMLALNGNTTGGIARVTDFSLAGIRIPPMTFVIGGTDRGATGLIGQDILGIADAEYDLAHGIVRLIRPDGCGQQSLAYWTASRPAVSLPVERDPRIIFPYAVVAVSVNGVRLRAVLDLGSPTTTMTLAAAKRLGMTPDESGMKVVGYSDGISGKRDTLWAARFDRLQIGDETFAHPRIDVEAMSIDEDLLLGLDFFRTHHVYVSNRQRKAYATYQGGKFLGSAPINAAPPALPQ